MSEKIILEGIKDLEQFEREVVNPLNEGANYNNKLYWVLKGYQEYLNNNSSAEERPYQPNYAAMCCVRRNNFLGWSMRTGKTLTSILMIYGLYQSSLLNIRPKSIHIAVPNILASMSWQKELSRFPKFKDSYTVVSTKKELLTATTQIIIYSHDFPKRKLDDNNKISKLLASYRPVVLIVDEIHGLKNANSLRTKELRKVRDTSRRVLALSGTPSEGNLKDIHNIMEFVYRSYWPFASSTEFSKQFSENEVLGVNYLSGKNLQGNDKVKTLAQLNSSRLPQYFNLVSRFLHRLTLYDPEVSECVSFPESEVITHPVTPKQSQLEGYKNYLDRHHEILNRVARGKGQRAMAEALRIINPLIELSNFPTVQGVPPKVEKTLEIIQASKGKVVIFCNRVTSAYVVSEYLKSRLPGQVIRVYAQDEREDPVSLDESKRIERVYQFQYNPKIRVGVFSFNIAYQAIELSQASDAILYCLPWSSLKILQGISRPLGPDNPHSTVKLHYPYHPGFIDEYQMLLAVNKIKGIRKSIDFDLGITEKETLSPIEAIRKLLNN